MKFNKLFQIRIVIWLLILVLSGLFIGFLFVPDMPLEFQIMLLMALIIAILFCLSKFAWIYVALSEKGIKFTYGKKTLKEFNWEEITNIELGAGRGTLAFLVYAEKYNNRSVYFEVNKKIVKYMIDNCSNEAIKNKLLEIGTRIWKIKV